MNFFWQFFGILLKILTIVFVLNFDNWKENPGDLWHLRHNWEPEFMTIFVTWQLRVTLDSIRNSCDVYWQHAIDDLPFIRRQTARLRLNNVDSNFPIKDNRIYSWAELFVLKLLVIRADMLITAMKMHENIHNYVIMKIIVNPSSHPSKKKKSNHPPEKYNQARYRLLQGWGWASINIDLKLFTQTKQKHCQRHNGPRV